MCPLGDGHYNLHVVVSIYNASRAGNGRFTSLTAVWRLKKLYVPLDDGRGNCAIILYSIEVRHVQSKNPGGSILDVRAGLAINDSSAIRISPAVAVRFGLAINFQSLPLALVAIGKSNREVDQSSGPGGI